ncbi:MAG: GDP-mannose 4,6-dehydratase [Nanoarchaeota archaeon]|nr:MAG: GDP-mannose 4,6-dehydratase [Nanoarchaeota archaeon]
MMKKAFITGITGQDGSFLAELLLKKKYDVYGLIRWKTMNNFENVEKIMDQITFVEGDLGDQISLNKAVKKIQPDEVYNLGALSFVGTSWTQPIQMSEVTGLGALRLIEAVKDNAPNSKFYQASSSEVFGNTKNAPQDENTPFRPVSPYAIAKVFGYWMTVNYRESYGMFACNGILFNHESERRGLEFVTRKITDGVARIKFGLSKEIRIGNLDARRDWGYAPEYVEGMWMMMQQKKADDFVLGTGETHSVKEFIIEAFAQAGIDDWQKYIVIDKSFMRPAEVPHLVANPSKAEKVLGWKAKTKFKELVKIMLENDMKRIQAISKK